MVRAKAPSRAKPHEAACGRMPWNTVTELVNSEYQDVESDNSIVVVTE